MRRTILISFLVVLLLASSMVSSQQGDPLEMCEGGMEYLASLRNSGVFDSFQMEIEQLAANSQDDPLAALDNVDRLREIIAEAEEMNPPACMQYPHDSLMLMMEELVAAYEAIVEDGILGGLSEFLDHYGKGQNHAGRLVGYLYAYGVAEQSYGFADDGVPTGSTDDPADVTAIERTPLYLLQTSNTRSCPQTSCNLVQQLPAGTEVVGLEQVEGEFVLSSDQWWRAELAGTELFVHSSLVSTTRPAAPAASSGGGASNQSPAPTTPPVTGPTCPNLSATCSQLTCDQAYACLAAGNRGLDRDSDGVPCESICPGG